MLAKVVEARPSLFLLGAVDGGTSEASISAVVRLDLVNTLLVSIEIIVGAETINLGASGNVALVGFLMPKHMLSRLLLPTVIFSARLCANTYLCSERFFETNSQPGC